MTFNPHHSDGVVATSSILLLLCLPLCANVIQHSVISIIRAEAGVADGGWMWRGGHLEDSCLLKCVPECGGHICHLAPSSSGSQ